MRPSDLARGAPSDIETIPSRSPEDPCSRNDPDTADIGGPRLSITPRWSGPDKRPRIDIFHASAGDPGEHPVHAVAARRSRDQWSLVAVARHLIGSSRKAASWNSGRSKERHRGGCRRNCTEVAHGPLAVGGPLPDRANTRCLDGGFLYTSDDERFRCQKGARARTAYPLVVPLSSPGVAFSCSAIAPGPDPLNRRGNPGSSGVPRIRWSRISGHLATVSV